MSRIASILIWTWRHVIAPFFDGYVLAVGRAQFLLAEISRSDAPDRPGPYAVANTSLSHQAIGLWTCLGWLGAGVAPWAAAGLSVAVWAAWEARQYLRSPSVRGLRDWLLGDGPSYAVGAAAAALLIGDAVAGRWDVWLAMTPVVVLHPGVQAVIFGRMPGGR